MAAELNPLFQYNAVLQCSLRVPVWGMGRDGERITVTFASQKVSTVVSNGAWKICLKPMKPNARPQTLTLRGYTTCVITTADQRREPRQRN
jgi:sialate O-acetylesterase